MIRELASKRPSDGALFRLRTEALEQSLLHRRCSLLMLLLLSLLEGLHVVVVWQIESHSVSEGAQLDRYAALAVSAELRKLLLFGSTVRSSVRKRIRPLPGRHTIAGSLLILLHIIGKKVIHLSVGSAAPSTCLITRDICLEAGEEPGSEVSRGRKIRHTTASSDADRLLGLALPRWLALTDIGCSATASCSQLGRTGVDIGILAVLLVLLHSGEPSRPFGS